MISFIFLLVFINLEIQFIDWLVAMLFDLNWNAGVCHRNYWTKYCAPKNIINKYVGSVCCFAKKTETQFEWTKAINLSLIISLTFWQVSASVLCMCVFVCMKLSQHELHDMVSTCRVGVCPRGACSARRRPCRKHIYMTNIYVTGLWCFLANLIHKSNHGNNTKSRQ